MNAGPFPTKEMHERLRRGTEGSFSVQDNGGGNIAYVPMYQLSSGVPVWVTNNDGSDGVLSPTPIKVVELSWQNVPVMFEALGLQTLNTETLTGDDIEKLEVVALDADHPAPPYAGGWLPRSGSALGIFSRTAQDRPEWVRQLENNAGGDANVVLALSDAFAPLPLTGQTIRVTFAGQGTLKLKGGGVGRPTTLSHPGVVLRALDAQGAEVAVSLSATTMGRRTGGNYGFVEPGNMPLRPSPSLEWPEQGAEVVWPPNGGAPYLHMFRRKSGGGVESHHIPSIPGLPQDGG